MSLLIPSMAVIQKYSELKGVAVYIVLLSFALFMYKYLFAKYVAILKDRQVSWLIIATFLLLLAVFTVIYPIANSKTTKKGSDRDEALNIATTELIQGHYPYYTKTYLGNPITPLPGSLVLTIPFVLIGNSAYQNFFWLFAFLVSMAIYLKDRRSALFLLWIILALSPVVMHEFVTGGNLLANSIYILLFVMWLISAVSKSDLSPIWKVLLAILLGVGLASRANFIFILPLVFSVLVYRTGWKTAIKYIAITCLTLGLMTLPFYFYDPENFSPLYTTRKLGQFQAVLPFSGIILPLITALIAVALSLYSTNRNMNIFLRNSTIVLAFPVLIGTVLRSIIFSNIDCSFTGYGLSFLFFGVITFWSTHSHDNK